MRKNRFLFIIAFAMFIMLPFSVNAEEFANGETKYYIEKVNSICKIGNTTIDLDDKNKYEYLGIDKESNFVYGANDNKTAYSIGINGCKSYSLLEEDGVNYVLSFFNTPRDKYIKLDNNKVYMEYSYFGLGSIEKVGNPENIKLNENIYCQYNTIMDSTTCGLSGSQIDTTRDFVESVDLTIIPSTNLDSTWTYYKISEINNHDIIFKQVSYEEVKMEIESSPFNALNYYIEREEISKTREELMTIENEKVLNLLNDNYATIYEYDSKNKIAYFFYETPDSNYGVIDSNGKDYGKEFEPFHSSNDLIWGLHHGANKSEYVIADKSGKVLYTLKDLYYEVDDSSFSPIYELNNFYKAFHEIEYKNYVYSFFINGVSKNNIYKIYEYKLLSEDNRTISVNSDYIAKFSGPADKVISVKVDDDELDVNAYVTSGSTIVTLDTNYLDTLSKGEHTLLVKYDNNITLTTKFTLNKENSENTLKVVFDANSGTFENNIKTIETEDIINFDYEGLKKPTRDGYKFIGFYTKDGKSYLDVMNSEAGIEEDTTFYAKWELVEEVPKTLDNITKSIIMGTISLIGLVGATIYLKKKNKVRT